MIFAIPMRRHRFLPLLMLLEGELPEVDVVVDRALRAATG